MRFLALLAVLGLPLLAQAPSWEVGTTYIPSTTAVIRSVTSHPTQLNLVNATSAGVLVTLTDLSTNCNGGPCTIWSAVVPASSGNPTSWAVPLNGQKATNGLAWVAGTANAVSGYIKGNY